jgi:hypothetical protein
MIAADKRTTGTYVMDLYQRKLIEVDKLGDRYYYRTADDREAHLMNDSSWESIYPLDEIQDEEPIQPGFYFVGDSEFKKDAVEILKYGGGYYFRPIGSGLLYSAHSLIHDGHLADHCSRVETDHINVGAMVISSEVLDRLNHVAAVETLIENMHLRE